MRRRRPFGPNLLSSSFAVLAVPWHSRATAERCAERARRKALPWVPDVVEDLLSLPLEEVAERTGERHLTSYRRGRELSLALDPRRLP